ncbi:MAG: MarC family protein [Desulfurococcales archaeon]|nr:MarC family protein [Desulfurococcales archaeon]MCE4623066.1 MarC family protein [Desulfurococcales archaeon]MCE4627239.1 MarC family protein [Desulfurococcales archaeon]MCE4629963.1 MarC family protein [Desulfurococcales archaeon]
MDIALIIAYYGSIVAIMNPFTALNNYLTLTEGMKKEEARDVLKQALIVVVALGLLFILAGKLILEFYHLSLASLKFGGGILLLYIAVDMLSGQPKSRTVEGGEIAVVPLATPMIIGPGTMTLLINLGTVGHLPEVITAFILSTITIAATMRSSPILMKMLRRNGIKAMARFMSLIIASVAAQMLWSAVKEWSIELRG